jgi:hypothetical protein
VTGGTSDAYCSDWIGIDGFSSGSVEQLGTEEDWSSGAPQYSAWWEMYPAYPLTISMHISPGDTMSAEVRWVSGNTFFLSLTDVTTAATFSTTQTLSKTALRSSAEWIHEAPSSTTGVLPLTHTTRCLFNACNATIGGTNGPINDPLWQNADMWMVSGSNSSLVLADTSPPTAGGTSFSVGPPISSYTLSYSAGPNGSIVGSSTQVVASGGSGTAVTAQANTGYHFVNWSDGSTANPRTDSNVTANLSVTANFAANAPVTYTLSYSAGPNGSIVGSSTQVVASGGSGTAVTAQANTGYHFVNWSDGSTANPRTDSNVTANLSVTANFAANAPAATTISITATPNSVRLATPFILSGALSVGTNGLPCAVYVKKPGSSRWSYSSNRLTYNATTTSSSWWYRYTPKLRGTYTFYVTFVGDTTHMGASTLAKPIKVAVR